MGIKTFAVLLAVAVTGCASNRFKEPASEFNDAVVLSTAAVTEAQAEARKISGPVSSELKPTTQLCTKYCASDATEKTICAVYECGGKLFDVVPLDKATDPVSKVQAEVLKQAKSLQGYSKALSALAGATTRADLEKATASAQKSLASLGEAIGKTTDLKTNVPPFVAIINTVLGNYLEWKRDKLIVRFVQTGSSLVDGIADSLESAKNEYLDDLAIRQSRQLLVAKFDYDSAQKASEKAKANDTNRFTLDTRQRESAEAFVASTALTQKLIAARRAEPFKKLKAAHAELKKEAENPSGSFDLTIKSISAFGEDADTLYEAVDAIR